MKRLLLISCLCAAAACDWDWYMNLRRVRWMISLFGRSGARIFYTRLGFDQLGIVPGYYQGREAALRMSRQLARN